ncbi:MAG: 5'-methylthioadenosine nucleosidase [Bacteroidetes bacterium CG12_big_fil_rev_8_21_14_0_65_60_17]|nr:MAG: 5'-methylthioadenosine nucleosidase [Bacteroidetes bacterium CG12_big_fil_rev_8_21_14_0_65_60_17]
MTGILFSTLEDAQPFLATYQRGRFDGLNEGEQANDNEILVSILGIGKIKGTLRSDRLLRQKKLTSILHAGTCTGLSDKFQVGELVSVTQVFEGDRIELSAPTYPRMPLNHLFPDVPDGILVTQDHTVEGASELSYWQRIADVSDMTGYPVAYVAATHGISCHIIKVVAGRMGIDDPDFRKNLAAVRSKLGTFLSEKIPSLLAPAE